MRILLVSETYLDLYVPILQEFKKQGHEVVFIPGDTLPSDTHRVEMNPINRCYKRIYNYIFDNVVDYCVEQIELGNYSNAYNRYKSSILVFEEQFAKPLLHKEMIKTLKLQISGYSSNKNV